MTFPDRKWTLEWKMEVVIELLRGGDATTISRSHGISQTQLFSRRDRFLEGGRAALRVYEKSKSVKATAWSQMSPIFNVGP